VTQAGSGLPPAGWYPDPTGGESGQQRWWDGAGWTAHVQAPPPAQPVYEPPVVEQRVGEQRDSYSSYTSYTPTAMQGYVAPTESNPTRSITISGVLIALSPVPQSAIILGLASLANSQVAVYVGVGITVLATIALAIADGVKLSTLGYHRPASWAWILLGPLVYICLRLVRTYKEAKRGLALLWIHVGVNAALALLFVIFSAVGFVILQSITGSQAAPTVGDIEAVLTSEIQQASGTIVLVDCPDDAIIEEGAEFNCTVANADGKRGITFVTMLPNGFGGLLPQYTEVSYPE
jgi:hypothetical protein